jgi:hypothetical protein
MKLLLCLVFGKGFAKSLQNCKVVFRKMAS